MRAAKRLIFEGLQTTLPSVTSGRAGVLVDERYGQDVIAAVRDGGSPVVLAVPVEASGHDWFTLEWGDQWLEHVEAIKPGCAKVLVRDDPEIDAARREVQLDRLVSAPGCGKSACRCSTSCSCPPPMPSSTAQATTPARTTVTSAPAWSSR